MNPTTSRRRFLQQTSATVASAALVARTAWAAGAEPRKIRMGIVGGNFGLKFQFQKDPRAEVVAVSDLHADRRANMMKQFQCETSYDSLEQLVSDEIIDAVAIFTDGPLHVEHTALAMKHGKHVISAVPAAWGTIEEAERLLDVVKSGGLTYMMAETSYYYQFTMLARRLYEKGEFGELFYAQAEYDHPGLETLYFRNGERTWRHGMAPMNYPTHTLAHFLSVTGERLTQVSCTGWGDKDPILRDNVYNNPFWTEVASFTTNRGHTFRARISWRGAFKDCDRAEWSGSKMSLHYPPALGGPARQIFSRGERGSDDAGFVTLKLDVQDVPMPEYWKSDMLPPSLRFDSGHRGSHPFLIHEFTNALIEKRRPTVDIYEALAYTVPGIVAHQSALRGGETLKIPQYDPPDRAQASQNGQLPPL